MLRLGDVQIKIKPEDEATLKGLYKDAAQIKLGQQVGGYQQFAAGKAMMGAAEGMANGGGGGGGGDNPMLAGAGMGIGMGMASMFQQQAQQNSLAQQQAQAQQQQAQQQAQAAAKFSGPDMVLAVEKIKKLKDTGILNETEFTARRQKLIGELKDKKLSDGPEDFLAAIIPLIEAGTLTPDDVQKIKAIVLA